MQKSVLGDLRKEFPSLKSGENLDFYELKLIEFRLSHLPERKKDFSGLWFLKKKIQKKVFFIIFVFFFFFFFFF